MARTIRVAFVSLGCAKNTVDSEKMLGLLAEAGCEFTNNEADADVAVINTCGFLAAARAEAVEVVRDLVAVKRKKRTRLGRVVVVGCLVQRDGEMVLGKAVPGIDALVGVHNRDDVVRAVLNEGRPGRGVQTYLDEYHPFVNLDTSRLRITPRHWAYLRISEGCDQKCTFCTIPAIRGPMHCKPPEIVLAEARELVTDGVKEIVLIGQDTTNYGRDIGYDVGLAGLLRLLDEVDGLAWIRLMYTYPSLLSDAVIDALAGCPKIVKYLDVPFQHINDRILKAMHRRVTRRESESLVHRLRERVPGIRIRTTLIAGFPGETRQEHQELCDFVRETRFDALGAFAYSQEPDTPAGRMGGQIDEQEKSRRVEELMLIQQEVAFAKADAMIGETFDVLIDGPPADAVGSVHAARSPADVPGATRRANRTNGDQSHWWVRADGFQPARHAGQAPEVDSLTQLTDTDKPVGSFQTVRCVGRQDYDLTATPT